MKKTATFLLMIFYTLSSMGMVVNVHFCGRKFVSASINEKVSPSRCSACGAKKMTKKCCTNKQSKFALQNTYQVSTKDFSIKNLSHPGIIAPDYCKSPTYNFAIVSQNKIRFYIYETGPPKTPIYLSLRSIII